jgi:hypothetical protein
MLELAQLMGQLRVFLTCDQIGASDVPFHRTHSVYRQRSVRIV